MTMPAPSSSHETEVIRAPSRAAPRRPDHATVFLAGTTTVTSSSSSSSSSPAGGDWRAALCARLEGQPLTLYDPRRTDWGANGFEEAEQTAWELDRAEAADLVVVYFGPATDAPVSLLELGLAVGRRYGDGAEAGRRGGPRGAVVVCVDPAYRKRGNVEMVCERYGVELVHDFEGLAGAVVRVLESIRE